MWNWKENKRKRETGRQRERGECHRKKKICQEVESRVLKGSLFGTRVDVLRIDSNQATNSVAWKIGYVVISGIKWMSFSNANLDPCPTWFFTHRNWTQHLMWRINVFLLFFLSVFLFSELYIAPPHCFNQCFFQLTRIILIFCLLIFRFNNFFLSFISFLEFLFPSFLILFT